MDIEEKIEFLKTVNLFENLPDLQVKTIAEKCDYEQYKRKSFIFFGKDRANKFYIICNGSVKITKSDSDGNEVVLAIMGSGEYFGEMAIIDDYSRNANAVATADCDLLTMDGREFLCLLKQDFDFCYNLLKTFCKRIRITSFTVKNLFLDDVQRRVIFHLYNLGRQNGLIKQKNLIIPELPNQTDLANLVGTSRETLSRTIKKLESEGILLKDDDKRTIIPNFEDILEKLNYCE